MLPRMETSHPLLLLKSDGRNSSSPWVDRVYLVDDHPFFATALASLINNEADLAVCGVRSDLEAVFNEFPGMKADIAVLDVNLSAKNNWMLPLELRKQVPGLPLLFVSSLQNPRIEVGMKWLEPCNFVEKTKDPSDIVKAIRQTLRKLRPPKSERVPVTPPS
jgi:DNA-binding NarL/FixJ family response regulator